jgi:hypothetical protein
MAIRQDLVCQYAFSSGYQTVKRFVRKLSGSEQLQAVGIILTAAGTPSAFPFQFTGVGRTA